MVVAGALQGAYIHPTIHPAETYRRVSGQSKAGVMWGLGRNVLIPLGHTAAPPSLMAAGVHDGVG